MCKILIVVRFMKTKTFFGQSEFTVKLCWTLSSRLIEEKQSLLSRAR